MRVFNTLTKSVRESIQYASLFLTCLNTTTKANLIASVKREESIVKAMCILPGHYTYEQVERALTRTGIHPDHLYFALSVAHFNTVLTRFYEAMEE
jgi:hypothetical protein